MLKKDGRIGRICWNRAKTLWCLGLPIHILEVTSNYTGFLTLATWVYVQQYTLLSTSILSLFHNIYSLQHPLATISPKGQSIPSWNWQLLLCWESWKHTLILGKISNQIMPLLGQQRRRIYWLLTKSSWTFYVRKSNHATAGLTALPYYIGYLPRVHGLFMSENR